MQITPNLNHTEEDCKNYNYIAYVRKSTEESDRQAMSIEAQVEQIKKQFPKLNITFIKSPDGTLGESMSAASPGRPLFNQMIADLESGKYQGVIAWHPDRISRNMPDAARFIWDIQNGIIKDLRFCNFTFEPTPEGIMMLQMIMSQAQYFSAKLSKDIKRGNAQKRKHGGITTMAPMGYINNTIKHTIEPDPERFDLVRHAFDLALTGNYTLREITDIMNEEWGFRLLKRKVKGGTPVSMQGLSAAFKNKKYAGIITDPYTHEEIPAQHKAMITLDEFNRVQQIFGHRSIDSSKPKYKEFPLRGLIRCGECGCLITFETKMKHHKNGNSHSYTYCHCTHKSKEHPCNQPAIREEDLNEQINSLIGQYEISPKLYEWGIKAIKEISDSEKNNRNNIHASQAKAINSVECQLDNLLDLVVRKVIDDSEYQRKSKELRAELAKLQEAQSETNEKTKNWYEIIGTALHTLSTASERFNNGTIQEKRMILSILGSNPTLKDKKIALEEHFWLKPIKDNLPEVRTLSQQIKNTSNEAIYKKWWSIRDSNS